MSVWAYRVGGDVLGYAGGREDLERAGRRDGSDCGMRLAGWLVAMVVGVGGGGRHRSSVFQT
jgi:hypothetical protein